ncbi:NAD(P)H-dependent glycerol-3-phosphate dehydrogenase [Nonomuraea sediminis]|uniref:NAD(P)H-dependent glycerol-3-phosphate dehydrogenase n=1 Tax=Nonomuraea sediminis TaxID=2835864 RepID=UPI001BDCB8AF|nr:NAD(P)H-dependent glycerol-3-phosphate dehydrogenase [Nonomuraea sediminis]
MTKAAVFGTGPWGTTFGMILAEAGNDTIIWGRRPEMVEAINRAHSNIDYLPGVALPPSLRATNDPAEALDGADFMVIAVPAQSLRDNLAAWREHIPREAVLVSLMKGIELGTTKRMSEVIMEVADVPQERVAVVSGPNLAKEIAQRQPAATVVACTDETVAARLQAACHLPPWFRPYTNPDVVGVELGGAVKNVIALAVGVSAGMGMGDNVSAMLITRGLAEISRLGAALGADPHTFSGLAGMGDLVATCTSPLSRNRTFGDKLGRGMPLAELLAGTKQLPEGVKSCESVLELAGKHGVEMPITEVVVGVVHDGMTPSEAGMLLMSRSPKPERYGV